MRVYVCVCLLLTLGPKKWEFRGGLVPPRLWARDETADEKVKMNNSSKVLQDHVRLLLSQATSRKSEITARLFNKYALKSFDLAVFVSRHTARRFPTSPFSTYHRRIFKFLVKQPQLKC